MASKLKRRLGFGCGIITLLGMGFAIATVFWLVVVVDVSQKSSDWQSEESQRFITSHFQKQLKLTAEQRSAIEPIIREGLKERWEIRRNYHLETDRLFVETYIPKINELLTEEQKELLQKRLANWRKENKVTDTVAAEEGKANSTEGEGEGEETNSTEQ